MDWIGRSQKLFKLLLTCNVAQLHPFWGRGPAAFHEQCSLVVKGQGRLEPGYPGADLECSITKYYVILGQNYLTY